MSECVCGGGVASSPRVVLAGDAEYLLTNHLGGLEPALRLSHDGRHRRAIVENLRVVQENLSVHARVEVVPQRLCGELGEPLEEGQHAVLIFVPVNIKPTHSALFGEKRPFRVADAGDLAAAAVIPGTVLALVDELDLELIQQPIEVAAAQTQAAHRLQRDHIRGPFVGQLHEGYLSCRPQQ